MEEGEGGIGEMMAKWRGEMQEVMNMMRMIGDWKEEIKGICDGFREGIKEQGKIMREELEKIRRKGRERERRWREERESLIDTVRRLEKKVEELKGGGEVRTGGGGKGEELDRRVREMEKREKMRDREIRRKNVIVKGLKVKEGKRLEAVEGLMKEIGAKVEVKEVWRVGAAQNGEEMVVVRMGSEEQRREVWEKKKGMKDKSVWIMDDQTWKERKMRWKIEKIAREEEGKGRKVRVGYGRIRIDDRWWKWSEEEEVLIDGSGKVRKGIEGEGKEGAETE
jgi:hypothetical protein